MYKFIVLSIVVICLVLYFIWAYLGASNSPLFSEQEYLQSLKDPLSAFHLKNLGESQLIIYSLKRYFEYFKLEPYSLQAQGMDDIARGVILLPIISFLLIYIVPPIVLIYMGWFIHKYFQYVLSELWGWFLMIYDYGTTLVECQMASKWYIRFITGWGECSPDFGQYFDNWRRQYVDAPIYYETLSYVEKYRNFKEKYFSKPKFNYIDKPLSKLEVAKNFSEKTFLARALENFVLKFSVLKYNIYDLPRDRIYRYILETNQTVYNKLPKFLQGNSNNNNYKSIIYKHGYDTSPKETSPKETSPKETSKSEDRPCKVVSDTLLLTYKVIFAICTVILIVVIMIYFLKYPLYIEYLGILMNGLDSLKDYLMSFFQIMNLMIPRNIRIFWIGNISNTRKRNPNWPYETH